MVRPKVVNIKEVAEKAKVSIASVSRVLNNQGGVSEALRLKIRGILEKEGVFSNHAANRGIKLAAVIEMVEPTISAYSASMLSGVAEYALREGIDVTTLFVPRKEKDQLDFIDILRQRNCDGVLLFFSETIDNKTLSKLIKAKIAVFLLAGQCPLEQAGFVDSDPVEGVRIALGHLRDLGHRKIAFLSGPLKDVFDNSARADTFLEFMKGIGVDGPEELLIKHIPTVLAQEAGYLQMKRLLEQKLQVTGVLANNDEMAFGAMLACHEAGLNVPQDISVVGYDDYPSSSFSIPPLTTVRQHLQQMGYEAAKSVNEYVCGIIPALPRRVLRPELIVRRSTGAAN